MAKRLTLLAFWLLAGCQVVAGLTDREADSSAAAGSAGAGSAGSAGNVGNLSSAGSAGMSIEAGAGADDIGLTPAGIGGVGGSGVATTEAGAGGERAEPAEGGAAGAAGTPGVGDACVPNQPVCVDDRAETCNANGTGYVPGGVPCTSSQTCVAGTCDDHECMPGTSFCSGSGVRICADNGLSSQEVTPCGQGQYCDPDSTSCKTGVCAPNQATCDGNRATTCNAAGSGYLAGGTTCKATESCQAGACKPHVCSPSETYCQGQDVKICAENGLSSSVDVTCSVNKTCVESGSTASCSGVCGPGQTQCSANIAQSCSTTGTWETALNCQTGKYCSAGACVSCPPSTLNCDSAPGNACEVDLTSTATCGTGCANITQCAAQHGSASCTSGTCGLACTAPYENCAGASDGCETNLSTDPNNCDACGKVCSSSHMASRTCGARTCDGTCAAGYSDCDDDKQLNGCEKHTDSDANFCGNCTTVCKYRSCQAGSCAFSTWGNNQLTTVPTTTKLLKNTLWAIKINVTPVGVTTTLLQALGLVVVVNGLNPAANIRMGLYTDSGGNAPNTLEAQTPAFVTSDGISERLLTAPVSIPTGGHWLTFVADQDVRVHVDVGTVTWVSSALPFGALPASYPIPSPFTIERGHMYAVTTP